MRQTPVTWPNVIPFCSLVWSADLVQDENGIHIYIYIFTRSLFLGKSLKRKYPSLHLQKAQAIIYIAAMT